MSAVNGFRHFKPAGPVAGAFLSDKTSIVRALLGPVGGGKTVTCIFDSIANACDMPVCRDGVIRFKLAVIGQTYGQMERNLLPTWFQWIPRAGFDEATEGDFTGGGGRFATHRLFWDVMRSGSRVRVEFEAIFAAIGEHSVEAFMRGFEPTAFYLYEMDLLPEAVLTQAIFRLGRFPKRAELPEGVTFRSYVIGDLNAPDVDSWFYRTFEEKRPSGFALYRQPSGRSPRAENVSNLPEGYYARQVEALRHKPKLVKRFVDAEYGPSDDGEPVYPEYSDDIHFAREPLPILPNLDIMIGLDAGLQRPAAVFVQWTPEGQFRVVGELVPGRMGARRFADQIKVWLAQNAPDARIGAAYADPAGFAGADREANEHAWAETVALELRAPILPAPSNEVGLRLDAVREELTFMIEPKKPAIMVSPLAPVLRKGFASHYRYQRQMVAGIARFSDKPEKNDWSHVHDALQYVLLGAKGRYGVVAGGARVKPAQAGRHAGTTLIKNTSQLF
jgi:hypothetical protein